jgi:hypothetical protein
MVGSEMSARPAIGATLALLASWVGHVEATVERDHPYHSPTLFESTTTTSPRSQPVATTLLYILIPSLPVSLHFTHSAPGGRRRAHPHLYLSPRGHGSSRHRDRPLSRRVTT